MSYLELFRQSLPEWVLVLGAMAVIALDLEVFRAGSARTRWRVAVGTAVAACLVSLLLITQGWSSGAGFSPMLAVGATASWVKGGVLALTVLSLLLAVDAFDTRHIGEHVALTLLSAMGMMLLASADDLLMVFVSLELTSLPLYVLTAWDKRRQDSAEAGLKYFLFGSMAAAFLLYGMSLLYGVAGSTELQAVARAARLNSTAPLLLVAMACLAIGFGFKVAVVPFHLWAPDTYQGAPAPSAAFIASGSKLASFYVLAKVVVMGLEGGEGSASWQHWRAGWMPLVAIMATASVILGNLGAITQRNVRRLLAYSAIAHGGYALLGVLAADARGFGALIYYALTYGITIVGAFGVVAIIERQTGGSQLEHFRGLSRRSPLLAACMAVFVLSLAGIPPLAGFFGKFYLFAAALGGGGEPMGLLWLVALAVAMSAVSLYYYLQILKQVYVVEEDQTVCDTYRPCSATLIAVALAAALVIGLGCLPEMVVGPVHEAITLDFPRL